MKNSKNIILVNGSGIMIRSQRQNSLVSIVNRDGYVSIPDLAKEIGVSESTIRRDIMSLDKIGKIVRQRGGASNIGGREFSMTDQNLNTREKMETAAKLLIAKKAMSFIKPGMTIYLDAGSTTMMLAKELSIFPLTVVTDSYPIASICAEKNLLVYLVGGQLKSSTTATVGPVATSFLDRFHFDLCFVGANAVNAKDGFMTPDVQEGAVKENAISRADQCYFLVDSTKFGRQSVFSFSHPADQNVISDFVDKNGQYPHFKFIGVGHI